MIHLINSDRSCSGKGSGINGSKYALLKTSLQCNCLQFTLQQMLYMQEPINRGNDRRYKFVLMNIGYYFIQKSDRADCLTLSGHVTNFPCHFTDFG